MTPWPPSWPGAAVITKADAAAELLRRRQARRTLHDYIVFTTPGFHTSSFSRMVCEAVDKFVDDVQAGKRPIMIFQAPPQHGKSEIVSRKLPPYLFGKYPDLRIAAASYSATLADSMSLDVRRNLADTLHQRLFPAPDVKRKYTIDRNGEFTSPYGTGSYIGDGIGGGFTGRPADIFLIDDPTKNAQEALSPTTKEGHWNWYQSTSKTRMSKNSGQIIMATSWAEDDLPGRIIKQHRGDKRLTILRFPAINDPMESGYRPELPLGALVPELHPLDQLLEFKQELSDYWWSAIYQQSAKALGGNVFKEAGIQFYLPKDLPVKFQKVVASWDCTFKDTDGTDFVVGQVWGRHGANCYLLDQMRDRMSFTRTVEAVIELRDKHRMTREILIEDKANGPAVIDTLKKHVPGILPIEPDGSKLARAHAVTSYWEAKNIWLPDPSIAPWVQPLVDELTSFPAAANDDQVDALTQALRHLYPLFGALNIGQDVLDRFRRAN
jgi:predicted phage terminase large subunit-like protein